MLTLQSMCKDFMSTLQSCSIKSGFAYAYACITLRLVLHYIVNGYIVLLLTNQINVAQVSNVTVTVTTCIETAFKV